MKKNIQIPSQRDIIWIDFDPQKGKEIMKRRPALVLSKKEYNKDGLAIICPITSSIKGYPFEVVIETDKVKGAILADQVKNLDYKGRNAEIVDKISKNEFLEVLKLIAVLIKPE